MYLFTPTIISLPESMAAWRRAELSSILLLHIPLSTALIIPPISSTSSIILLARSYNSSVRLSIAYDPVKMPNITIEGSPSLFPSLPQIGSLQLTKIHFSIPAKGSMTWGMPVSLAIINWVLRAIRALKSLGKAIASSIALVWRDWVPKNRKYTMNSKFIK